MFTLIIRTSRKVGVSLLPSIHKIDNVNFGDQLQGICFRLKETQSVGHRGSTIVALSTTESEFITLNEAAKEALWLKFFVKI